MTFSPRPDVQTELERLLIREGLGDPAWALSLDQLDEPPLFLHFADAEFLRELPPLERALSVVHFGACQLDRIRSAAFSAPSGASNDLFGCLTLQWWDDFASDEAATVCPCFLIVPRHSKEHDPTVPFLSPQTANGHHVAGWLEAIGRRDLLAAEIATGAFERVYVGYRSPTKAGLQSVGDFMAGEMQ
jgi:hypothetical protein